MKREGLVVLMRRVVHQQHCDLPAHHRDEHEAVHNFEPQPVSDVIAEDDDEGVEEEPGPEEEHKLRVEAEFLRGGSVGG